MSRKRFSTEQIVHKLRDAEVELAKGRALSEDDRALFTVVFLVLVLVFFVVLVGLANKRWTADGRETKESRA